MRRSRGAAAPAAFEPREWFAVLDVETRLSEQATSLTSPGDRPSIERAVLHEVVAGTLFTFARDAGGAFGAFSIRTWGEGDEDEPTLLRGLHAAMAEVHARGATLVTFNGAHDLSVLRRRAGRHWYFGLFDLEGWTPMPGPRHVDVMRDDLSSVRGRWPNLVDACAGFGINAVCEGTKARSSIVDRPSRKCQVDCIATALLFFHRLSFASGAPDDLARGWAALSRYLIRSWPGATHLRQFARHPFAAVACEMVADAG